MTAKYIHRYTTMCDYALSFRNGEIRYQSVERGSDGVKHYFNQDNIFIRGWLKLALVETRIAVIGHLD